MNFVYKIDSDMQGGGCNNSNECKKYIPADGFAEKILCIREDTGFLFTGFGQRRKKSGNNCKKKIAGWQFLIYCD